MVAIARINYIPSAAAGISVETIQANDQVLADAIAELRAEYEAEMVTLKNRLLTAGV